MRVKYASVSGPCGRSGGGFILTTYISTPSKPSTLKPLHSRPSDIASGIRWWYRGRDATLENRLVNDLVYFSKAYVTLCIASSQTSIHAQSLKRRQNPNARSEQKQGRSYASVSGRLAGRKWQTISLAWLGRLRCVEMVACAFSA